MDEDSEGKQEKNEYLFNVITGVIGVVLTLVIGYVLSELSRLNGLVSERGERITRIEGHNDRQDDEIKRIQEEQGKAAAERKEIFDYLTGKRKP